MNQRFIDQRSVVSGQWGNGGRRCYRHCEETLQASTRQSVVVTREYVEPKGLRYGVDAGVTVAEAFGFHVPDYVGTDCHGCRWQPRNDAGMGTWSP